MRINGVHGFPSFSLPLGKDDICLLSLKYQQRAQSQSSRVNYWSFEFNKDMNSFVSHLSIERYIVAILRKSRQPKRMRSVVK